MIMNSGFGIIRLTVSMFLLAWVPFVLNGQIMIGKIDDLSQFSPRHIHRASSGNQIFIYSLDGLNVFNGKRTKVYKKTTHNLLDNRIMGRFFEDPQGNVWFTTHQGIHMYDRHKDDFDVYQIQDENGMTLDSDYELVFEWDSVSFVLKAENRLVIYNSNLNRVVRNFDVPFGHYSTFAVTRWQDKTHVVVGDTDMATWYIFGSNSRSKKTLIINGSRFRFIGDRLFVGTREGHLEEYDVDSRNLINKWEFDHGRIIDVQPFHTKILVTAHLGMMIVDQQKHDQTKELNLFEDNTGERLTGLQVPTIDQDSILWIGINGKGVYLFNLAKARFEHWPVQVSNGQSVRVTKILEDSDLHFYIFSFTRELFKLNRVGDVVEEWNNSELMDERVHADWYGGKILFEDYSSIKLFDPIENTIDSIKTPYSGIVQSKVHNQQAYFSMSKDHIAHIQKIDSELIIDSVARLPEGRTRNQLKYFFFDAENRLYVSGNDLSIFIFDYDLSTLLAELEVDGGLLSLTDVDDHVLITNRNGLFRIDKKDFTTEHIIDKRNRLTQQIYGLLIDDNGFYWMSTNNGLYRYDPRTELAHQFKIRDGLQATEYNRMSYLKNSKGQFMFGGINGINVFEPLEVKLSDKQAQVDFYNYKINDTDSREFGVANYVNHFDLYHKNNTITFQFVGIDYTGTQHVNLKYFMEGYDKDWVEIDENDGLARYANLPYGEYTFHMLASNSDEVWSDTARKVSIIVHPPFWATWWFLTLVGLLIIWTGYWGVRSYYRRKLEYRDLVLKQQALIIEKQEAVEYERNRIASEMHDDLGSGLTTIKYLSEHVMKSTGDGSEKNNIKRIADHAKKLVINMSEIIWAMNSRNDTASDLVGYIRRYASEYLEEHKKILSFSSQGITNELEISGEKRRNLFLVTKEILHNFIKYAGVEEMNIDISANQQELQIQYLELGSVGFNPADHEETGHGLYNMKNRMDAIGGQIIYEQTKEGMKTTLSYPLIST